MIAKHYKRGI